MIMQNLRSRYHVAKSKYQLLSKRTFYILFHVALNFNNTIDICMLRQVKKHFAVQSLLIDVF